MVNIQKSPYYSLRKKCSEIGKLYCVNPFFSHLNWKNLKFTRIRRGQVRWRTGQLRQNLEVWRKMTQWYCIRNEKYVSETSQHVTKQRVETVCSAATQRAGSHTVSVSQK